ncbi:hypothetical protein CDAR_598291 [Caerostris darwini]|uniref:Uncharacterized protein n=1 Tax=Caerostris darwini TaxID=1538125 RepID=A0AAV4QN07_9ARAC|nr:hypothetical protein CDAR_598291 [Caerostris darwini]
MACCTNLGLALRYRMESCKLQVWAQSCRMVHCRRPVSKQSWSMGCCKKTCFETQLENGTLEKSRFSQSYRIAYCKRLVSEHSWRMAHCKNLASAPKWSMAHSGGLVSEHNTVFGTFASGTGLGNKSQLLSTRSHHVVATHCRPSSHVSTRDHVRSHNCHRSCNDFCSEMGCQENEIHQVDLLEYVVEIPLPLMDKKSSLLFDLHLSSYRLFLHC